MNAASERAREACESCRRSHKKCTYDNNSTRCRRCEKRDTPCSLFLSVETTAVAQQDAPASESAPDSWVETPYDCAASSSFPNQFPPQENYYWDPPVYTETTQGGYPADMTFQSANQREGEQPTINQDGSYDHNNVFQ